MILVSSSSEVFACHDAACAPPPAGTGGSRPRGGRGSLAGLTGRELHEAIRENGPRYGTPMPRSPKVYGFKRVPARDLTPGIQIAVPDNRTQGHVRGTVQSVKRSAANPLEVDVTVKFRNGSTTHVYVGDTPQYTVWARQSPARARLVNARVTEVPVTTRSGVKYNQLALDW